jgi:uncharacterized membrane protein
VLDLKPLRWFEIVFGFTVLTLIAIYLIPGDSILVPIRFALGFVFIVFLPGYCLVNILFLGKNSIDIIESLVLSVALSWGITGIIGLFLGLSPIGINFSSITISLGAAVLLLAVVGYLRKTKQSTTSILGGAHVVDKPLKS